MAGLSDTPEGGETRRNGDTVGVPHTESDGTRLENAAIQPGDAVGINGSGNLALADSNSSISAIGVLVNYGNVYGASHQGEQIDADVDANVAVQGTYKVKVDADAAAGGTVGTPDASVNGQDAGQLDSAASDFRVIETYDDGPQSWAEVVL